MQEKIRFRLYHFPATRSARVKWILHEVLDNDFSVETVNLYAGDQYRPPFVGMNPNHAVPVLELQMADGRSRFMVESVAMISWLADAFPEKGLAPVANELSIERADYLQMLHFAGNTIDSMLWQIRSHEDLLPINERDENTVTRYRSKFATEIEPQLIERLSRNEYICGDQFTAADCVMGHNVTWARLYDLCQQPVFTDYVSRLASRPAFKAAFADAKSFTRKVPGGVHDASPFNG